jgi:RND family efflux transporter MFP subunit
MLIRTRFSVVTLVACTSLAGCRRKEEKPPPPQPLPVKTEIVKLSPVPRLDEYVATLKSRRSAELRPQVDGPLKRIRVKSGDRVRLGQPLMTIDPRRQQAIVEQQRSGVAQKKATFEYARREVDRERNLYQSGSTSKESLDSAVQAFEAAQADLQSAMASLNAEQRQLGYYELTAPFAGVVGDIPVHLGDYVSPQSLLTTIDESVDLEIYIYIPTERGPEILMGLPVQVVTTAGDPLETTEIGFISRQVDDAIQGILVKAPIRTAPERFRNAQVIKARVVWSTAPMSTVPVLAVTRIGGQSFVYVATEDKAGTLAKQRAVTLGDTIGNDYAVIGGLSPGDKVIVSGIQLLVDGAPIKPMG